MKKWWSRYFYWNRTERRGIVPLLALMFVLMGVNIYIRNRSPNADNITDTEFLAQARAFDSVNISGGEPPHEIRIYEGKTAERPDGLREKGTPPRFVKPAAPFNPNGLPQTEWVRLGLTEAQAASVKRFEEKGGRFYKKEDVKKLYVVSEAFYANIEPFINIPPQNKTVADAKPPAEKNVREKVDINRADSATLAGLYGITPKMAQRMLRVRETFGGFHSLEQVKDLYGFHLPNYEKLSAQAYAGPANIRPLNVNYCTFKELLAVPGMNYDAVKTIMNYREKNGSFKKTDDLVALNLAEPGLYVKIAPYLTVK